MCDFSRNIIEQVFLTNQKLEMNMPQIFKTKCIVKLRKYIRKKNLDLQGVKVAKLN